MIPARKQRWFNAWFAAHARSRIQATFGAVLARGAAETRALASEEPLVLVANHSSWWDPLVILHLSQHVLQVDGYAMMDAKNLRKLPFFAHVGAFGVELERPEDGMASVRYAARLLDQPGRAVWIFPQGRERPSDERPLAFQVGAAVVARVSRARVVPVALRYEFAGEERPLLYASLGEPLAEERDPDAGCAAQELAVTAELDRIRGALRAASDAHAAGKIAENVNEFQVLYRAQASAMGRAAERLLAHWTRPGEPLMPALPGAGRDDRS